MRRKRKRRADPPFADGAKGRAPFGSTTKDERDFLLWTCEKKNEEKSGPTLCRRRKG